MSHRIRIFSGMGDIRQVMAIYQQAWPSSFGIIDLLSTATECLLLQDEREKIIGYAFVEEDQKRGFVELQDIAILPEYRGKKGGKRLLEAIMERYPFIKLIARASNQPLIAFYQKMGFTPETTIENYYDIGQDGLRMAWKSTDFPGK